MQTTAACFTKGDWTWRKLALGMTILMGVAVTPVSAFDGVALEYGAGGGAEMGRAAVQWQWDRMWRAGRDWRITGYWDGALAYWRGQRDGCGNEQLADLSLTPVFRLQSQAESDLAPYFEMGFLGIHLLSKTQIHSERRFGSAVQFNNQLGIGLRFGVRRDYDLSLRLQHISNGGIKQPNQGINFAQIRLGFWF